MNERLRIMDQESMEGDNLSRYPNGENGNDAKDGSVERQPATAEDIHPQSEFQDVDDVLNELLAEYAPAETAPAEGEEPERREGKKERLQPAVVLASAFGGANTDWNLAYRRRDPATTCAFQLPD